MAVVKLVEDYAVAQLRKDVRDAMMMGGEQSVLLSLYHPGDPDALPCPQCGDDVYKSAEQDCLSCFGTRFNGGVRYAMKVWAIYGDHDVKEQLGPRGTWQPDQREVTFECFPTVTEHDVLVRVQNWGANSTVAVMGGFYILQQVQLRSLRTGNRYGQASWDVVSQKAQCTELNANSEAIAKYPILSQAFEESIQLTPATTTLPPSATLEPDVKVVYVPFEVAPGGVADGGSSGLTGGGSAIIFTQAEAASTWTITHNLGYQPSVAVMIGNEEVDTDVDYPDNNTVVILFGSPQVGTARLT